uniref:HAD-IA family hydrolase n=1 Tax=Pararhizobium sp. IMCC3301 TaxID=3067904 RepID=UPI002741B3FB|nr:HAD-IA family hydrolase [Pararhizobium sp. IMCC3301]
MRLILFDCDGTLIDSQHMIVAAMDRAFTALELEPPSRERTLAIIGRSLHEAMTDLTDADHPIEKLVTTYRKSFFELRSDPDYHEPLYEGAKACLDALAAQDDVLLGLATGKSRRGVDAILDLHSLQNRFVTIQTSDNAPSKPDPAMVQQALRETGASAAETVLIGDTSFDMMMARNASIEALGVTWGYHQPAALMQAGAGALFDSFAELQSHLLLDQSGQRS